MCSVIVYHPNVARQLVRSESAVDPVISFPTAGTDSGAEGRRHCAGVLSESVCANPSKSSMKDTPLSSSALKSMPSERRRSEERRVGKDGSDTGRGGRKERG